MMTATILDHLYVILFAVIYPAVGFYGYRKIVRLAAAGNPPPRTAMYQSTIVGHWAVMVLGVLLWAGNGRSWAALGFGFEPDLWFGLAVVLALITLLVLWWPIRALPTMDAETFRKTAATLEPVQLVLPSSRSELSTFYRLSVTAGIVEEVLWRGFLITYLSLYMPVWAAGVISAVGFGLAHSYQGPAQVPKIAAVGGLFVVLYLLSGSVWVPIVTHALFDVLQGRLAHDVISHPLNEAE